MKNEIYRLTEQARSVRVFNESHEISEEVLRRIVDCARIAPSAGNLQSLKYRLCFEHDEAAAVLALTRWAGYLPDAKLPPAGHAPAAFIVIYHDSSVCQRGAFTAVDVGIAAQTVNLAARAEGLGVCMIGSFDRAGLKRLFGTDDSLIPELIIALGEAQESPELVPVGDDGSIKYYRDGNGGHFVPKRSLEEILL